MTERDPRIMDLIGYAVNQNPVEFQQTFNDIVTDRLAQAVDDRKQEIAQAMFADEPVADAQGEDEQPADAEETDVNDESA
jgi:hypothetical protein